MNLMTELHGMVVHFPIALLITSVALELLALHPRLRPHLETAALILLILGAAGTLVAVATGPENNARGVSQLIRAHQNWADATAWLFSLLALFRLIMLWMKRPVVRVWAAAYLLVALLGIGMLSYTGWLGGHMVYTEAIGVSRNGQPVAPPVRGPFGPGGGRRRQPGQQQPGQAPRAPSNQGGSATPAPGAGPTTV